MFGKKEKEAPVAQDPSSMPACDLQEAFLRAQVKKCQEKWKEEWQAYTREAIQVSFSGIGVDGERWPNADTPELRAAENNVRHAERALSEYRKLLQTVGPLSDDQALSSLPAQNRDPVAVPFTRGEITDLQKNLAELEEKMQMPAETKKIKKFTPFKPL